MEETYITKAIVLWRQAFRENDLKVAIYSREKGRAELVVRGGKKLKSKLAAHLEPLNLVNIMVVRGRQFDYAGAAVSYDCQTGIKNDLEKLNAAGRAIGLIKKMIKPREADRRIYNLLKNFLKIIDYKVGGQEDLFYFYFSFKLLAFLGYAPELYNCVHCRARLKPENNKFSLEKGGIVCAKCAREKDLAISADCIKMLRLILVKDLKFLAKIKLNNKIAKEISLIIGSFLQYIT